MEAVIWFPEMIWDEQVYRSESSTLLVLSNTYYDPKDYIHDFEQFKELKLNDDI